MLRGKQSAALETARREKLGWGPTGMLRGWGAPWEVLRSPWMLLRSKGVKGCPGRLVGEAVVESGVGARAGIQDER